jgi:hypothetical protein
MLERSFLRVVAVGVTSTDGIFFAATGFSCLLITLNGP